MKLGKFGSFVAAVAAATVGYCYVFTPGAGEYGATVSYDSGTMTETECFVVTNAMALGYEAKLSVSGQGTVLNLAGGYDAYGTSLQGEGDFKAFHSDTIEVADGATLNIDGPSDGYSFGEMTADFKLKVSNGSTFAINSGKFVAFGTIYNIAGSKYAGTKQYNTNTFSIVDSTFKVGADVANCWIGAYDPWGSTRSYNNFYAENSTIEFGMTPNIFLGDYYFKDCVLNFEKGFTTRDKNGIVITIDGGTLTGKGAVTINGDRSGNCTNTLVIAGGTHAVETLVVSQNDRGPQAVGVFQMDDGTVTPSTTFRMAGNAAHGMLVMNGGTLDLATCGLALVHYGNGYNTYRLNGGTIKLAQFLQNASVVIDFAADGGMIEETVQGKDIFLNSSKHADSVFLLGSNGLTLKTAFDNTTCSAVFGNLDGQEGRLVKAGAGTLTITAPTAEHAITEVREGTLVLGSAVRSTAGLVVDSGATLDLTQLSDGATAASLAVGDLETAATLKTDASKTLALTSGDFYPVKVNLVVPDLTTVGAKYVVVTIPGEATDDQIECWAANVAIDEQPERSYVFAATYDSETDTTAFTLEVKPDMTVKREITITAEEGGSVNFESGKYLVQTEINVTATPDMGWSFLNWEGTMPAGCDPNDPEVGFVVADDDVTLSARFVETDKKGAIDLSAGDVTIEVADGGSFTATSVTGGAHALTVIGAGALILPEGDYSSAWNVLVLDGASYVAANAKSLGSGAVTLQNGAKVTFGSGMTLGNVITVPAGSSATIEIPEGMTLETKAANIVTKSATLVKTGLGVLKTTDTLKAAQVSSSTWICEQGDILFYGNDEEKTHVIEMHEGTRLRQGLNVFNLSLYATVCLRGAQYVFEDPYNSINSNVDQDLLHFSTAHFGLVLAKSVGDEIMGFKALASAQPSTITFDAPLLSVGAIPFEVEEGAVLNLDANLRGDGVGYIAGIKKTGAGTLRLLQSPYDRCVVSVDAGTLALAGHNVRLGNKATVNVAEGAKILLENGGVFDSVGGANANALIAEASVHLDAQALADEYADAASLYSVANLGLGGGVFTRYSASGFLSYGTNCVNGKPGFWSKTTASSGLGGAGQVPNTGSEVSIYLVCDPNLANFTFADENHGKNSSPIWFTKNGVNDDSTREGAFRYNYDAANKFRIYFQGNDASPLTVESDDVALSKGAFIDCIRRDATTASFLRWYSDSDEFSTNLVDQAYKNFNFFNCSIDAKMKSTGNIWQNNTCPMNLGEVLVFTRKLTDDEDKSVRGYLAKKWFGSTATWPELPKTGVKKSIAVAVEEGDVGVLGLELTEGEQTIKIVKEGEGTLVNVSSLSNSSEIVVREGALAFDSVDSASSSAAAIWFDAADAETVTVTDGIVSKVKNKGWAGGDFTPDATNVSGSPTIGAINGRQAVWFDGTDDFLRTMAYTNSTPRKLYVYLVTQRGDYKDAAGFFSYTQIESDKNDDKQVGAVMAYAKSETSHGIVAGTVGTNYGTFDNSTGHTVIDVYSVGNYGVMFSQVDAERPYTATIATKNLHAAYPSDEDRATQNNLFQIGARKNGNDVPRWFWQGAIGEVLVFDAPLTVDQQVEMFDYLRAKWMGLPGSAEPPLWLAGRSSGANKGVSLVQKTGTTLVQNGPTVELAAYEAEADVAVVRTSKWLKDSGALFATDSVVFGGVVELGFSPFPRGNRTLFTYGETCTGFDSKAWSFAPGSKPATVSHDAAAQSVDLIGPGFSVLVR